MFGVNSFMFSILGKTLVMLAIANYLQEPEGSMEEACCSEDKGNNA